MSFSLAATMESSWQHFEATAACTALLGAVCHQAIRTVEIDSRGWELVLAYLAVSTALLVCYIQWTSLSVFQAVLYTWSAGAAFLAGLYSSMLLYRVFFHRLGRFPGPPLARVSKVYQMAVVKATDSRYHVHMQKLHERYGDFVRTGPRELSVLRISAINLFYGPDSPCEKATWYDQNSGNVKKVGIENIRRKEEHRIRRRLWDKGLGFRALSTYEPRVKAKVDMLMSRLGTGKPLNVTQEATLYSWDIIGDVAFSEDFHMLQTGQQHPAVEDLRHAFTIAGFITTLPWLMNMLRAIPGLTGQFERFAGWCSDQLRLKRESLALDKVKSKDRRPRDVMAWLINAQEDGDRSAPPTKAAIQEDARLLISAGSDTVATTLTNFLYFMVKHPDVYRKLQRIVETEFPEGHRGWTYAKAKKIAYLDHIIHETLRLRPSVPMGFPRQTPPEGLQVDEVFIPGDTNVFVPTWTMHRDPRYFDRADEFVPERWETMSPDTAAYLAFQRGPFSCSGRNLAMMQLRMLISCTALRYNVAFAPGEDGVAFGVEEKEKVTLWVPGLQMVFTPK